MDHKWEELVPGRLAKLSLRGDKGRLDVFVAYLSAQDGGERMDQVSLLLASISPPEKAASWIAGDFNFVCDNQDRWSKMDKRWTGDAQAREARHWKENLWDKKGVYEVHQGDMTHSSATYLSRIDRIYTNIHRADLQDHSLYSAARKWVGDLSDHRPVLWGMRSTPQALSEDRPLPTYVFRREEWKK